MDSAKVKPVFALLHGGNFLDHAFDQNSFLAYHDHLQNDWRKGIDLLKGVELASQRRDNSCP